MIQYQQLKNTTINAKSNLPMQLRVAIVELSAKKIWKHCYEIWFHALQQQREYVHANEYDQENIILDHFM